MQGRGCGWFWAWSVVGAACCFTYLTGFSIGPLLLPFAVGLLWLVGSRSPRWQEAIGFAEGIGFVLVLIAYLNWDYAPCPSGPQIVGPGQSSFSCGGFDPHPWLYAGVGVAAVAAVAYAVARQFPESR